MKRMLIGGGIVSTLVLAACGGSDLSSPATLQLSSADTLQAVSLSAADATAEDVNVMNASEASMDTSSASATPVYDVIQASGPSFSTAPSGSDSVRYAFWAFAGGCTYSNATGRFACPDVVRNGLTLSHSAAFTDANGAAMSHYNDTTTASANFLVTVQGVHPTLLGADTLSRTRNMTATGLLGHETSRTWNGTGLRSDAGYANDQTHVRTYHTSDTTTFANVVVKLPRSTNPWPMSGTITRQIHGTGSVVANGVTRTFTISKTVTITFNGTRLVPMTIGTVAFTLDLYTGKASRT